MKKKILTVKDLLQKKEIIKNEDEEFYSELLNGCIAITNKINRDSLLEYLTDESKGEYERYRDIIYLCCPIFKSDELREAYKGEIDTPVDIVDKVFCNNMQEVINLGNFIFKKFGFLQNEQAEKIKKQ